MNFKNLIQRTLRNLQMRYKYFFQSDRNIHPQKKYHQAGRRYKANGKEQELLDIRIPDWKNKLNRKQKSYSPMHDKEINPTCLHFFLSRLPNKMAKLLAKTVESPKNHIASDSMHFPKIEVGSIPIYHDLQYNYFLINKMWTQLFPISIFFFSTQPALSSFGAILGYFIYYKFYWSKARNMAIQVDLVPHKQEIKVLLANSFGKTHTKTLKIQDIQMITLDEFDWIQKKIFNQQVCIRNKVTGQLILFSKNGLWSMQGTNHQLII